MKKFIYLCKDKAFGPIRRSKESIMGLYLTKTLKDASIGLWEISESVEELYASVKLSRKEQEYFSCLKSPTRKQHWLSYRLILPHLVKGHEGGNIYYDENGKPFLNNGLRHISVSHSGKFSALIASRKNQVGIDIERLHPKIYKVSHKFLNKRELRMVFTRHVVASLCVIWAAKEAMFKLYGKRDLEFKENFRIFPFRYQKNGKLYGEITGPDFRKVIQLEYQTIDKYILVYAVDQGGPAEHASK